MKTGIQVLLHEVIRAVNSAGECYLHTVEVTGSNPVPPTKYNQQFRAEAEKHKRTKAGNVLPVPALKRKVNFNWILTGEGSLFPASDPRDPPTTDQKNESAELTLKAKLS